MKKLILTLLPNFLILILSKIKYKKENIKCHNKNIKDNRIINIKCNNTEKYNLLKNMLYKSFSGLIRIDKHSLYFTPIAIVLVPTNIDQYLKEIGAKSRNMNKKAEKNSVSCRIFDWNDRLEDIYNINISSLNRQGRKMDDSYLSFPKEVKNSNVDDYKTTYIGSFVEDKLIGYIELYIYGNFIMTNRILGHSDYLRFGIMNLMIKGCVEYGIENKIDYINYLTMQNTKTSSLSSFKKRVGFREYSLEELK